MRPVELQRGHSRSVAGADLLHFRRAPGRTPRFRHYELLDCLFDLFNAADSILELRFKPRSYDVLGFDARKAILLKFTIHSTPPGFVFGSTKKLRDAAIFSKSFSDLL
jgi:hypothetical protein